MQYDEDPLYQETRYKEGDNEATAEWRCRPAQRRHRLSYDLTPETLQETLA
jgi:hypothetical protein